MERASQAPKLPLEMWRHIFSFCRVGDLVRVECVCREFHQLIRSSQEEASLWKPFCQSQKPVAAKSQRQWTILNAFPRRSKDDLVQQTLDFCRLLADYRQVSADRPDETALSKSQTVQRFLGISALATLLGTITLKWGPTVGTGILGAWIDGRSWSFLSRCPHLLSRLASYPIWVLSYAGPMLTPPIPSSVASMISLRGIGTLASVALGGGYLLCRQRTQGIVLDRGRRSSVTRKLSAYVTNTGPLKDEEGLALAVIDQLLDDHLKNDEIAWRYCVHRTQIRGLQRRCLDYGLMSRRYFLMSKMLAALETSSIPRWATHDIRSHLTTSIAELKKKTEDEYRSIKEWLNSRINTERIRRKPDAQTPEQVSPWVLLDLAEIGRGESFKLFETLSGPLFQTRLVLPSSLRIAPTSHPG